MGLCVGLANCCFGDWRRVKTKVARLVAAAPLSVEVSLLAFYVAGGDFQNGPGVYVDVEA